MSLTLSHTPCEYDGTFAILVRAAAVDFLTDGPIAVEIIPDVGEPGTVDPIRGDLVDYDSASDELRIDRAGGLPLAWSALDVVAITFDPEVA